MKESDYNMILNHYEVPIPKSRRIKRKMVEDLLSDKMCRCIKSVEKTSKLKEPAAIAICNQSIFRNRGLKYNKLKCYNISRVRSQSEEQINIRIYQYFLNVILLTK